MSWSYKKLMRYLYLLGQDDEHFVRNLYAVVYRYLEKRGRLPEQKQEV